MPTTSSPNHQTIEFLSHYLLRSNPGQAVMVTGGWGCGKTWLVQNALGPKAVSNGYTMIYVTLLGVGDLAALQDRVASTLLGAAFTDRPTGNLIANAITDGMEKIGLGPAATGLRAARALGSGLGNMVKDYALKKALEGKLLLVFDDLERSRIPVEEMFGYLSSLVGGGQSRVLVISNEEKAHKEDGTRYESIKEKLVSHTLRIHADIAGFLDVMVAEWPTGGFKTELANQRRMIGATLQRIPEPNLRAVRVALTNCSLISDAMADFLPPSGQEQIFADTKSWYFEVCFGATLFKRMTGKSGADYLGRFGIHASIAARMTENNSRTLEDAQAEVDADVLFTKLSGDRVSMKELPAFLALLIDHGRLDRNGIINHLSAEYRTTWTQLEHDLHIVGNGFVATREDAEARATYDRVFKALTQGDVKDPTVFLTASSQLLQSAGVCWEAPPDYEKLLLRASESCIFSATEPPGRVSSLLVASMAPIRSAVDKNIVARNATTIQARVRRAYAEKGPLGALSLAADDNDPGFRHGILCHLDAQAFWASLAECSNLDILEAQSHISFRINRGGALGAPKDDEEWLTSGIGIIDAIIAGRNVSPSRNLLGSIRALLVKIMNGSRKPPKTTNPSADTLVVDDADPSES